LIGFAFIVALALPSWGHLSSAGDNTTAGMAELPPTLLRIVSPVDAAVLGDGNLVMIETAAVDPVDGVVDEVEVSTDDGESWADAQRSADDPTRWQYLWSDPAPGVHRIRARALGIQEREAVEQSVVVRVSDTWASTYVIENPYSGQGSFRKGQLHVHSTRSFDGWTSVPPAELALEYRKRGYQFVVITDHDTVSDAQEVNDSSFITIPGYESTADTGHITGAFADEVVSPSASPQERISHIIGNGGFPILNHPGYTVGWDGTDFRSLAGYRGFEIFNGITSNIAQRYERNTRLWHEALMAKGFNDRIWAVAVDDAHAVDAIDRGWVMVKSRGLTRQSLRQAMDKGSMYASNGPSFGTLGILRGAVTASSPDAVSIRFIDQDLKVLAEGPASWATYRPKGAERFVRVEAIAADGRTAWSQPFWLTPNAPRVSFVPSEGGMALVGETVPGATVHVSDFGEYQGFATADGEGRFTFVRRSFAEGPHDFWLMATGPWPGDADGVPALLSYTPTGTR
jgi:hypothetical protein